MRIAVYPGGFDPLTNGHLDLITRMTHLFDRVIVAVVKGRDKGSFFTWEERVDLVTEAIKGLPSVEVEVFDELMVEFAKRKGAVAVVRGIRAVSDFEAEFDMALMNRIREVSRLGYDVADMVPPHVRTALRKKHGQE
jgi:pantetheine-phosphate adenylyltransferase